MAWHVASYCSKPLITVKKLESLRERHRMKKTGSDKLRPTQILEARTRKNRWCDCGNIDVHLIGRYNHVTEKHGRHGRACMLHSTQPLRNSASFRLKDPCIALLCRGLLLFAHEKELFRLPTCRYFVSQRRKAERAQPKAVLAHVLNNT